jgi:hypothetical protein
MLANIVNGADLRVPNLSGRASLTLKAFHALRSLRRCRVDPGHLKGDGAVQMRIMSLVHRAHAAGTDALDNSVAADGFRL